MVQVRNIKTVALFEVFIFVYYYLLSTGENNFQNGLFKVKVWSSLNESFHLFSFLFVCDFMTKLKQNAVQID